MNKHSLNSLLRNPRLSRREFVTAAIAAGLTASAANGLFSAAAHAQAQPKKGGRFRLGVAGANTTDVHDPATWGTGALTNIGLWGAVYNNLMEVAPDGQLVSELAETVEPAESGKVWRFKLRSGVTFHNGKTLDAEDVIASFNHHRGPDSKSAAKAIVDPITDLKADGKDTVVFTLKEPNADFPYLCTDYHMVIGSAVDGKIDWQPAIGTGGYALVSHDPGVKMEMKRNAAYWKAGRAHFDEVELLGLNDVAARMNSLVTGQTDAIGRADLKTLGLLKRNPDIVIEEVTGTQHYTMPMFTDVDPFKDNNVRLALKYGVDREAMVKTILLGHGVPGNDHPITPANRYYAADLPIREYDPEKAKYHLKQAGLDTLKVDLSAAEAAFSGAIDTAVLFKEQAAKAGIDVNVVREADDGYWTNVWTKKPFVMAFWGGRPTEDWMLSLVYAKGAPWNDTHWGNERFDKLLVEARAELDEAKRKAMYGEMQKILRDEGGAIIPMYANYVFARSNKVARGEAISKSWELDGWKCIERWWFA
ncbi:MAG: ABC transporter substrate-binding protein [Parvibaculaceae bacterium]